MAYSEQKINELVFARYRVLDVLIGSRKISPILRDFFTCLIGWERDLLDVERFVEANLKVMAYSYLRDAQKRAASLRIESAGLEETFKGSLSGLLSFVEIKTSQMEGRYELI